MQLRERVFEELTSPSFVTLASATSSVEEARVLLVQTIKDQILNGEIESEVVGEEYWDDIVDVADGDIVDPQRFGIIRRWDGYGDDYRDAPALLSEYQTSRPELDWAELDHAVMTALKDSTQPPIETASVLRLDIVDLALYQALCKHPELLRTLNWRAFERLLADILESFGFEVELQRGTKDGGVDIFAIERSHPLGTQRYLLQAKKWTNAVGVEPVRQLAFLHTHYKATKSCLATTATFTRGAWELAHQYKWQIELKDYDGLVQWVRAAARIRGGNCP